MFVNLTPHTINLRRPTGGEIAVHPSGTIARVGTQTIGVGSVRGIPVVSTKYDRIEGIPAPNGEDTFIVSLIVRNTLLGRADVVAPDTGPTAIRNEGGQVIAVTRLIGVAPTIPVDEIIKGACNG